MDKGKFRRRLQLLPRQLLLHQLLLPQPLQLHQLLHQQQDVAIVILADVKHMILVADVHLTIVTNLLVIPHRDLKILSTAAIHYGLGVEEMREAHA